MHNCLLYIELKKLMIDEVAMIGYRMSILEFKNDRFLTENNNLSVYISVRHGVLSR